VVSQQVVSECHFVKSEARRKPIAATHYGNEISDLLTAELIHKNKQEFPDF